MSDHSSMANSQNNSQTAKFLTALERARLVAAKFEGCGSKRSLEDGPEPSAKKVAPSSSYESCQPPLAQMSAAAAQPQMGAMGGGNPRGGLPMGGGGGGGGPPNMGGDQTLNEYIRVPDKMVGLIIGRGGEQITRLQAESGCKIQMAPPGDTPDRLCTLTGSKEAIAKGRELVNQIVNCRGRENAPQDGGMMGGNGGGNGAPPQLNSQPRGGGGGGMPVMEEIMLPGAKVGLIIGKSGKTIKQLQEQSGAKMVVIQDGPKDTEYEKPLRISGDPDKVEHAKMLVFELLSEKEPSAMGGGPRPPFDEPYQQDQGNGLATNSSKILVPEFAVRVVIGKGGDMIKKIQSDTRARVQFHQNRDDGPGDKWCYLQGKPQQVEAARQMIEDIIASVSRMYQEGRGREHMQNNGGQRNGEQRPPHDQQEIRVMFNMSSIKCGLIIGRGGEVIKQINAMSGAHCELDRRANMDRTNRTFIIKGLPENVEQCKRIITEKCGVPVNFIHEGGSGGNSMQGGNNGGHSGGNGAPTGAPAWGYNPHWHPANAQQQPQQQQQQQPQVQINPSTGQPDYSQQWIEYYRTVGMIHEAEAIEQQHQKGIGAHSTASSNVSMGGPSASNGPSPSPGQAQGGQADCSVQWAEYYRSIGKHKEADAIEAQIKMKQQQPMGMGSAQSSGNSPSPKGGMQFGHYGGYAPGPYQYGHSQDHLQQ